VVDIRLIRSVILGKKKKRKRDGMHRADDLVVPSKFFSPYIIFLSPFSDQRVDRVGEYAPTGGGVAKGRDRSNYRHRVGDFSRHALPNHVSSTPLLLLTSSSFDRFYNTGVRQIHLDVYRERRWTEGESGGEKGEGRGEEG